MQWRVCEVNTFGNRVEKGGCVVERVRDRNMERKNERVSETDSFLRCLGEEDRYRKYVECVLRGGEAKNKI